MFVPIANPEYKVILSDTIRAIVKDFEIGGSYVQPNMVDSS